MITLASGKLPRSDRRRDRHRTLWSSHYIFLCDDGQPATKSLSIPESRLDNSGQRANGKRDDVALAHCMRKLLHFVFAIWKSGRPSDLGHYPVDEQQEATYRMEARIPATSGHHRPCQAHIAPTLRSAKTPICFRGFATPLPSSPSPGRPSPRAKVDAIVKMEGANPFCRARAEIRSHAIAIGDIHRLKPLHLC